MRSTSCRLVLFCGEFWVQVAGQEAPDLLPGLAGELGVYAVEDMASRSILIDLVLEVLACGLESGNQVLNLQHIHVLIAGVGVDQQRRLQFVGMPGRRAQFVFGRISKALLPMW